MNLELKDKVAIVTGASRGIGKSIAEKLANNGCRVVIISRKIEDLNKVKDKINSSKILCYECDTTNQNKFKEIIKEIYDKFGSIDILINNAGITRDKLLLRLNEKEWDEVINVNLKGYYNTIKIVSRYMLKNRSGKIINISSVIGQIGNSGQSNYAASKAGVEGMTRALAVELGVKNINVNCIAPGPIQTDLLKGITDTQIKKITSQQVIPKQFQKSDVCDLVELLLDERASSLSGQVLHVGGF